MDPIHPSEPIFLAMAVFHTRNPFYIFQNSPEIFELVCTHEKTKDLIYRSWLESGSFIDMFISNEPLLQVGLKSDYFTTDDGVRRLQSTLKKYPHDLKFDLHDYAYRRC